MSNKYSKNRADYLPPDLLQLSLNWLLSGEPKFKVCPNNPDKIWVLSSGGYLLHDKIYKQPKRP